MTAGWESLDSDKHRNGISLGIYRYRSAAHAADPEHNVPPRNDFGGTEISTHHPQSDLVALAQILSDNDIDVPLANHQTQLA